MHNFHDDTISDSQQSDLLDELDVRCHTNVATIRQANPKRTDIEVTVRAGNACDRGEAIAEFRTSQCNEVGLNGISAHPIMVGSVFLLSFGQDQGTAPPAVLAVCERCSMLGQSSFDLRFRFTQPLELHND